MSMIDGHRFLADYGRMPKLLPLLEPVPTADVCCTPLASAPLSPEEAADLALRFKALADPGRLRLLSLLMASESGESCTCDLTELLGLSQPTVSHHLKTLVDAGILARERRGSWAWFRLDDEQLAAVRGFLA
jgi:ArsR family transcriptional regulator, arsenate/arsenite/antimonite-responsive transcriptional repressor